MSFWRRRRDLQSTCWLRRWACIDGRQPSGEGCKQSLRCRASKSHLWQQKNTLRCSFGAEGGIWTLAPFYKPTPLAGEPLQPLGYFCKYKSILPNFSFFTSVACLKGRHCESRGKEARNCRWQKRTSRLFALHTRVETKREQIVLVRVRQRSWPSTTWVLLHVKCFAILTHKRGGVNYFLSLKQKI